jgi:phospholipid-binding lipoprotein MlaA
MNRLACVVLILTLLSFGCGGLKTRSSLSPLSSDTYVLEGQTAIDTGAKQPSATSKDIATNSAQEKADGDKESDLEDQFELEEDFDFEEEYDPFADEAEEPIVTIADPLEPVNRAIFHFNDRLYFWVMKPAARGYNSIFPEDFRICVRNFFTNLLFPVRFVNCLLQANFRGAGIELSRFAVNSTLGLGGLFDPSSRGLNLPMQDEDSGQTLGVWRVGHGFFLNLPLLGPSSVRETVGTVGDTFLDPMRYTVNPFLLRWGVKGYKTFNEVSLTLGDYEALKEAAIDPYIAVRNAYIQYRESLVKERGVFPEQLD